MTCRSPFPRHNKVSEVPRCVKQDSAQLASPYLCDWSVGGRSERSFADLCAFFILQTVFPPAAFFTLFTCVVESMLKGARPLGNPPHVR